MPLTLRPLADQIVVTCLEAPEKSAGGVFMPDTAKEKPQEGRVRAVGPAVKNLRVDERILYRKYAGSETTIAGEEYLLIAEKDVLAVIDGRPDQ
jgi:chaperonin GroES